MRITSNQDLSTFGNHARSQLEPLLNSVKAQTIKSKVKVKSNNPKPSRIMLNPLTKLKFCPFPSTDPGAWLHTALNLKYGPETEGGHHAHETIIPGHKIKFRWDHIIYGMVCIELDGYGAHFDLKSFKRDREKQKHALVNGYIVHRVTTQNIKENLQGIIDDVETMMQYHPRYKLNLEQVGNTQYRLESRTLISI